MRTALILAAVTILLVAFGIALELILDKEMAAVSGFMLP